MKKLIMIACLCVMSAALAVAGDACANEGKACADGAKACACNCEKIKGQKKGEKIQLSDLPAAVKEAAEKQIEGLAVSDAMVIKKDDGSIYKVFGKAGDKNYVVVVSAEGKVIKSMEKGEKGGKHKNKEGCDKEAKQQ